MSNRNNDEPRVYMIPKNFLDSGYVFGGRFKQRNFIEAAVLTAPVLGIFLYGWKVAGWDVRSTVAACVILCAGIFMAAVAGIGGDSLLEFLNRVQHFRTTKQIAKYNPRVKLEYKPEYLEHTKQPLPREKMLELAKGLESVILGDDGLPVSADITDERLVVYFRDDEGFVEKPQPLKTHAELKAEAREAKRLEKERKKQDAAFVQSLPRGERRETRKRLKEEARARADEAKRRQNEERQQYEARIEAALAKAQQEKEARAAMEPAILPEKPKKNRRHLKKKGDGSNE